MSQASKKTRHPTSKATQQHELIHPFWMLKAIAAVIVLAVVCAYVAICALFFYGQWQIVLSPSRTIGKSPSSLGMAFQDVRFGPGVGGEPELSGWWIPTAQAGSPTVLVLHGGSGRMSDLLPQARLLHDNRLNVFLFDYRGFGKSSGTHPTQLQMEHDSEAALAYLNNLRLVSSSNIIVFGEGLGASLATKLCGEHHDLSAMILENADGDFETRAVLDSRSRIVPVSLLFNQKFPLADPLHTLATPKLLISYTKSATPPVDFARAADPKLTVELGSAQDGAELSKTLRRFLDSYVAHPPSLLVPQVSR